MLVVLLPIDSADILRKKSGDIWSDHIRVGSGRIEVIWFSII